LKKILAVFLALMISFAYMPHVSDAKGFGGSRSFSRPHTSYNSGYRSPTMRAPGSTFNRGSSIMSHAASFGLGMMLGHMFHPFGGYYGGQSNGFSFFGLLVDFVLFLIIISLIRRLFGRRRY